MTVPYGEPVPAGQVRWPLDHNWPHSERYRGDLVKVRAQWGRREMDEIRAAMLAGDRLRPPVTYWQAMRAERERRRRVAVDRETRLARLVDAGEGSG